jgi:hypothetical protein
MHIRDLAISAAKAEALRERTRRSGYVGKHRLWSPEEDRIVIKLHPDYGALIKAFRGRRTYFAIRSRASALNLVKRRRIWTAAEKTRLRRMYPRASRDELLAAFPFCRWKQIVRQANYYGLRRGRRSYCTTGSDLLDAIRNRCAELGYTMADLDAMTRSKRYFTDARWLTLRQYGGVPKHKALLRAVDVLGGNLTVTWVD